MPVDSPLTVNRMVKNSISRYIYIFSCGNSGALNMLSVMYNYHWLIHQQGSY